MTAGTKRPEADNGEGFWSRCFQVMEEPVRLLDGKKERDDHVPRPLFSGEQEKGQQSAEYDRQEDSPNKSTGSHGRAGPLIGMLRAHSPTSYPEEGQKSAAPQMLGSGARTGAMNMEQLLPIAERLIGSISSLTTELRLVRHAVERQAKPLQSK